MAAEKILSVRLSEAVDEYIGRMRDRDRPLNSIHNAQTQLSIMKRFIGNKLVRHISQDDIDRYYALRKTTLKQSSMNHMTSVLNEFFRWCVKRRYLSELTDPMDERGYVKVPHQDRRRLTADQFPALLDAARNPRDRMLLALMIYTLARSSEITSIRVGDLNLVAQEAKITRTKNSSGDDSLPIVKQLDKELRRYLTWYTEQMGELDPHWYLLPRITWEIGQNDETGRFMRGGGVVQKITPERHVGHTHEVVQKAMIATGWEKDPGRYSALMREGAHTLRRSAARELFEDLRRGGDDDALITVMTWLGHADPKVTLVYIGIHKERERRNKQFKGRVMFQHAEPGDNVVTLPIAEAR